MYKIYILIICGFLFADNSIYRDDFIFQYFNHNDDIDLNHYIEIMNQKQLINSNHNYQLKKIIDQSNINYSQIQSLYYFKSKRWDLKFTNKILIKLPEKIEKETLDKVSIFLKNIKLDNKEIIDARIKNQIIILDE